MDVPITSKPETGSQVTCSGAAFALLLVPDIFGPKAQAMMFRVMEKSDLYWNTSINQSIQGITGIIPTWPHRPTPAAVMRKETILYFSGATSVGALTARPPIVSDAAVSVRACAQACGIDRSQLRMVTSNIHDKPENKRDIISYSTVPTHSFEDIRTKTGRNEPETLYICKLRPCMCYVEAQKLSEC